ncbi:Hypothetical protein GLP15_1494 [Giardia lamblia P15]|uniref:Uncharacterized protein n=1 Tax=Giardia intestinalis (strain P15) TaxID=658858 RepID=E1EYP6_GIAIA|nr:Hypothetical protein GLP15_1494 [Giardia lamblia P15]
MTSFPIRIGPSDFLFYGKGSSTLRVHAVHSEPLMVIFQTILRQANLSYALEKNDSVVSVRVEPSAVVMNPDDKKAITISFSPTHISSFAVGKLLVKVAKLHTEEVIGTYQVPLLCLAACTDLSYELFQSTNDGTYGLTVINTGSSHGFICIRDLHSSDVRIISPGERIFLSKLSDASSLFMAPVLAHALASLLADDVLLCTGMHTDVIADLKVEFPESVKASIGPALDEVAKMAYSLYSSYTSYPFRSDLLRFLINRCVWCSYNNGELKEKPVWVNTRLASNYSTVELSGSSAGESVEPQLLSSSDLSITLQPLANSNRPIGGISDRMLSSSDSVPIRTHFPDHTPSRPPAIPPASTSTLEPRRPVIESGYNLVSNSDESPSAHVHQAVQKAVTSYRPSNLCKSSLPLSSSTSEPPATRIVTASSAHTDTLHSSKRPPSITSPQLHAECKASCLGQVPVLDALPNDLHSITAQSISRMKSPSSSAISTSIYGVTQPYISSTPSSATPVDDKEDSIIKSISIQPSVAPCAYQLESNNRDTSQLPSEHVSTNVSSATQRSVTFTDDYSRRNYHDHGSFNDTSSVHRFSTPTPSQSIRAFVQSPADMLIDSATNICQDSPAKTSLSSSVSKVRSHELPHSPVPEHVSNPSSQHLFPSGYDLQYKIPNDDASSLEKELIDQYNSALSEYRCLTQTIKDNSRSVSKLVSDLKEEKSSTSYMLEQEFSEEYLPDVRPVRIHFAEDSIIYNNPAMKRAVNGVPIYERPKYNATMFWRVLNDSFLLGGSPFFPPYLESHRGVNTTGGICYLTGSVTIENNANQAGFMNSLLQSETLRNVNVLGAAEDLHYLYYSLSFVTFDPNILRMRLSIKATRPLTGRLSPGERHTIGITIAMAYSDVSGTGLPEIPMFLQSLNRGPDGMCVVDSGAPLFLRVFGARFDRQFFQDELESLDILQNTIRTPSRFNVRECIDLPVRFLDGIVYDRNITANPANLQEHKIEMQCSRKGAMASYPSYTYTDSHYPHEENNTQCFNLPFLRFLASIPLIKVEEGQSMTFPELLLYLPDTDVYAQRERRQQQALLSEDLAHARNSLASRPGADVLFLSGRASSSKQRKHAIDAMCTKLSSSQSLQNPMFKGDVISAAQSIPVVMPTSLPPGGGAHTNAKVNISVTPASTPVLSEYIRESVTELSQSDSGIAPAPILTSAFECFITALYTTNETPYYLHGHGQLPPGHSFASEAGSSKTEVILSLKDLEKYSNVTKSTRDSTEYPVATITFVVRFTRKLIRRLLRTLSSCENLPCFLEQKYEININNFAHPNASSVSYQLLLRVPLQIDPSSLVFLKSESQVARVDRLMGSSAPQYNAQLTNSANLLISNCAMNVKAENINGFLNGLWTDSYFVNLPPSFAGAKSFGSISLHNASDYPVIAILSGLALPFSYRTTCRLEPLSSLLVPINFAPKRPGQYNGTLTISYSQVVPDQKQEELLLQKRMLGKGFGTRHAFSKEHYLELDALEHLTVTSSSLSARPKSTNMWDNMVAKPAGAKCKDRAQSSKTISRNGLSHMVELKYGDTKIIPECNRSQILPPGPKKAFYVKLSGLALNTPLLVTQPPSQLHNTHPEYESEIPKATTIYLQKGTHTARILLTNVSDRALLYDIQLLIPEDRDSHDAAYHILTVMPPSGCIEPKCQAAVSLHGAKQFHNGLSIVLNIYTKYRSDGDLMMALSYRGLVKVHA